jgi:hypothetical protein
VHSLEAIDALNRVWARVNRQFCDLLRRGQLPCWDAAPGNSLARPALSSIDPPPGMTQPNPGVDLLVDIALFCRERRFGGLAPERSRIDVSPLTRPHPDASADGRMTRDRRPRTRRPHDARSRRQPDALGTSAIYVGTYPYPVISLEALDLHTRDALTRYIAGLSRRTGMVWDLARLSKPGRYCRALLVNAEGAKVRLYYYQATSDRRPRWRASSLWHVTRTISARNGTKATIIAGPPASNVYRPQRRQ